MGQADRIEWTKLICLSSITDRCQSNQENKKNSLLTPWFWLMPNRSYNRISFQLNFYWKLRMGCFAMQVSLLRKGWVETHFPQGPNSELFIWPIELHILFHFLGHERPRFIRSSLVNSRKNILKLKKTSNYPSQDKPPVPEIPPDLSASRKKPRGV